MSQSVTARPNGRPLPPGFAGLRASADGRGVVAAIEEVRRKNGLAVKTLYRVKDEGRGGHPAGMWPSGLFPLRPRRTGARHDRLGHCSLAFCPKFKGFPRSPSRGHPHPLPHLVALASTLSPPPCPAFTRHPSLFTLYSPPCRGRPRTLTRTFTGHNNADNGAPPGRPVLGPK